MKCITPCQLFIQAAVVFGICAGARAAEWYEAETAAGNPLATLTNIGLGYEYTHDSSSKEKFIPNANWTLGASLGLQRGNRYTIGQLPLTTKWLGLCLFYIEWLRRFVWPRCGEEVLVTARRPD